MCIIGKEEETLVHPSEFLDETYPAKTIEEWATVRRVSWTSTVFDWSTCVTDGQTYRLGLEYRQTDGVPAVPIW